MNNTFPLQQTFDHQIQTLLEKDYPNLANLTEQAFLHHVLPLKENLSTVLPDQEENKIPFVIVIKNQLVPTEKAMEQVKLKNTHGLVNMYPKNPQDFAPIPEVEIPEQLAYLLIDIDTGHETLNVTPNNALKTIQQQKRLPLTIDEGVALVTHFPEILKDKEKYNCFSMLASRYGDKRVPALWISYGKPRLGWCWAGNPHTWLGSASCKKRI